MEILWSALLFVSGLAVLYVGAEGTLYGAIGIARRIGISPLLIGLTLIAYGTSAPELAIDITAAVRGKTDLAFGDLVGSNLANLGLILGVAVIIRPIQLNATLVRFEIPLLVIQAILVWVLSLDGTLGRVDGCLILILFGLIAVWTIYRGVREKNSYRTQVVELTKQIESEDPWRIVVADAEESGNDTLVVNERKGIAVEPSHAAQGIRSVPFNCALVLIGLFGLISGAQLMVYGAVSIARTLGVSELTIGLTIVAVGTSLPELATAVLASRRKESDIVIGNVAGSNLFNIGCVLGIVACIVPVEIQEHSLRWEIPLLIGFSAFLLPIAFWGGKVQRWMGYVYVTGFAVFLILQVVQP